MKSLTVNQLSAIIAIATISNKLLILPSLLYRFTGQDALFVVLVDFAISFAIVGVIIYVLKKNPDKTLRELISGVIGKVAYKVLVFIIFVLYIGKTILFLMEGELFLGSTMFADFDRLIFILPVIFSVGYVAYKGLQVIGRTCEAFVRFVLIGLIITLLLSLIDLDISNILPLGISSIDEFVDALNASYIWFGNYFILFFCLGDVKLQKNTASRVFVVLGISSLFVLSFFVMYYASFEYSSIFHKFAISDISQFTLEIASFTKVDWFTVIIWLIIGTLQACMQIYILMRSFFETTGLRKTQLTSFLLLSGFVALYIFHPFNISQVINIMGGTISILSVVLGILFTAIILISHWRFKSKNREVYND